MSKAPQPIKGHLKAGESGPGLRCKGCGMGIAIAQDLTTVPAQFRAVCPKCGHDDEYSKSAILSVAAHRKQ